MKEQEQNAYAPIQSTGDAKPNAKSSMLMLGATLLTVAGWAQFGWVVAFAFEQASGKEVVGFAPYFIFTTIGTSVIGCFLWLLLNECSSSTLIRNRLFAAITAAPGVLLIYGQLRLLI